MSDKKGCRKLKVDFSELIFAMDNVTWESSYYLDMETGQIILVTSETRNLLEEISEEIPDDTSDEEGFDLESAIKQVDVPDWQKQALQDAKAVEEGFGDRYIEIPRSESDEAFDYMEEFTETVLNQKVQYRLSQALGMNHPFRRFKEVLVNVPDEQEQWFKFKEESQRKRALEWLEDQGIEPIF